MDQMTHEMRLARWTQLIQECNESGLNKLRWCKQNSISNKSFYYWQRRVREEVYGRITAPNQTSQITSSPFVQLPVAKPLVSQIHDIPAITIKTCGYSIEISESISDKLLNRLIEALSYVK